ncbi:helix-turn-helix transcriptional regulator [Embleya scabrispora]|uniref:helix-turn-helix transcriptional regulator n=1 Tax=Embleya scabrispora TaxID=159449 RepID=UPI000D10A07D|nr:LuxR family transcriptional regulator [Embleya scabrispora]MYS80328.1 AAA family ATPase [Streptomyces sp. SID5474]
MGDPIGAGSVRGESRAGLFVGRVRESQRLDECADKARRGESWLAVVEGEAGIGKTALLRRFSADLAGFTLLWATGDPSESDLPGGVVGQLVRRLDPTLVKRFPLLAQETSGAPAHAVGGQLLLLLGALQEDMGPVAVVVDDLQWADTLSVQTLGFVVRRLWADRVLTVLATRPDAEGSAGVPDRLVRSSDRAVRIGLDGLDDGDVAQLARGLIEARLAPALVRRLHAYTRGHPLYLRTVLAEVPVDTLRDEAFERWPVPRSLQVGIRAQVDRLPRESVELLEAMAVLDTRVPLATAARLAALEDPARALGPALAVGLAQWWPTEPQSPVALVHALQRDAVYDAIGPERRRALHAGAAALVGTAAAWTHRVAAATSADPQLADELEQSATREASSGRNALAATRLLWASALSEHRDDRERRLLTACAQSLLTMQPVTAAKLRPQVEDCAPGPLRSCVLGVMDMTAGRFPSGEALLNKAWRSALAEPGADWVAVLAGTFLANIMLRNGRGAETVEIARQTLTIGDLDPATTDFTRAVLATGRLWDRGPRAALRDVAHLPAESSTVPDHQLDTLATRGVLRLFLGELASARADLATVARRDRQGAGSKLGSLTLSLMSVVDYLDGDWNAGESAADRALAIAAAQDQRIGDAAARFAAVCVQAGRGQWDAADGHVEVLSQLTQALGSPVEIVYSSLAAATLAQARADHPAMLRALEPLLDRASRTEGDGIRLRFKPFWLWQQSLLVEALTGTGQLAAAARALRDLHEGYDGTGYLRIVVARLAGVLAEAEGRPRDALAIYEQAVGSSAAAEVHTDAAADSAPLYRAMLEQAYGRTLSATGSAPRRQAAKWLTTAHGRFGALRADPFLRRCAADLSAVGLGAPAEGPDRRPVLTERELSVAHLIAGGRTNQEAAAELYVSHKTIEYHLSNIYTKLGISSRRQLGEALGGRRA